MKRRATATRRTRRVTDRAGEARLASIETALRDLAASDKNILGILQGIQQRMEERDRQFFQLKNEDIARHVAPITGAMKELRADVVERFVGICERLDRIEKNGHGGTK